MSFDQLLLLKTLGKETIIKDVKWYDEISSSQDLVKSEIYDSSEVYTTLIGAEVMTSAKGQYTRKFITSKGNGLYFSFAVPHGNIPNIKQHIKLLMAVVIANTIKKLTNLDVKIKFPNDIYFLNKKLCGVLVEEYNTQYMKYLIIGVGLNVNEPGFPSEIKDKATSIFMETGIKFPRELLTAEIIKYFTESISNYQKLGMKFLKAEFSNHSANHFIGKLQNGELIECDFVDLTENGYLVVYSKERKQHYTFYFSDLIEINI